MSGPHDVAILGLGAVGRRFVEQMRDHPRFRVVAAHDPSPVAQDAALALDPGLRLVDDPDTAIASASAVHVATPPVHHAPLGHRVLEAGRALFCEKPLTVDLAEGRALVTAADGADRPSVVNFVFASAPSALAVLEAASAAGGPADTITLELDFAAWPRPMQADATWLTRRDQGGFTREVLSHYVFLLARLTGRVDVVDAEVHWSDGPGGTGAEVSLRAELEAGPVRVAVDGQVSVDRSDRIELRIPVADGTTIVLRDWYQATRESPGRQPELLLEPDRMGGPSAYAAQLDQLAACLDGGRHTLPDLAEAHAVSEVIEELLRP